MIVAPTPSRSRHPPGTLIPITKHNYLVRHIEELPQVSERCLPALRNQAAPPGVDRHSMMQTAVLRLKHSYGRKAAAPAFSEESIRDAAAMITPNARCFICGGDQRACARVRELAEKAQLPTTKHS